MSRTIAGLSGGLVSSWTTSCSDGRPAAGAAAAAARANRTVVDSSMPRIFGSRPRPANEFGTAERFVVTNNGPQGTNSEGRPGDLDLLSSCVDSACMSSRRTVISAPLLFAIATAFGVSSTIQAYYLSLT